MTFPNTAPRTNQDDFTVVEFANALRIHKSTVHKFIARGELRMYKVGRLTRIPREEYDRLRGQAD